MAPEIFKWLSNDSWLPHAHAAVPAMGPSHVTGGFWQRHFVQNVLPFLTSLSLHCGILIVGLLTFKAIQAIRQQPEQFQIAPSITDLVDDHNMPDFTATAHEQMTQAMQDLSREDTNPKGLNAFPTSEKVELSGGNDQAEAAVIGIGARSSLIPGHGGTDGPGSSQWVKGGWAHRSWGLRPQRLNRPGARRIAFVCDASGSMINKLASLKMELQKAITGLKPIQSFTVVFFNDKPKPECAWIRLWYRRRHSISAKPERFWTAARPGSTNPIPGIEAAFQQPPFNLFANRWRFSRKRRSFDADS